MANNITTKNREVVELAKRIVRKANAEHRRIDLRQLCREVRMCRPTHFYVNYDRAALILHNIDRYGDEPAMLNEEIRAMWFDLYAQVKEIMRLRPKLTFPQALTQALFYSRPKRFYMSEETIRRLITRHFCYVLAPADDFNTKQFC